eukprot:Sspe_Gene.79665::Locus_49997_Transcript_1_1_Confidence_1.000_Length_2789::g.79665::m.79665
MRWLVAAVVGCAVLLAHADELESSRVDDLPRFRTDAITVVAVVAALTVTMIALMGFLIVFGHRVRLVSLLFVFQFAAITVVGILTWIITYTATREELNTRVTSFLLARGSEIKAAVIEDLQESTKTARLMQSGIDIGLLSLSDKYPRMTDFFRKVATEAMRENNSITTVYMGNERGEGGGFQKGSEAHPRRGISFISVPPTIRVDEFIPGIVACAASPKALAQACVDKLNETEGCRSTGDCTCSQSHCESSAAACQRTCGVPCSEVCAGRVIFFDIDEEGRAVSPVAFASDIDPRLRPWYTKVDDYTWSMPYPFGNDLGKKVSGFTLSKGVRQNGTGVFEGVIAVDSTTASLQAILQDLVPTANSKIFLVDLRGKILISASFDLSNYTEIVVVDGEEENHSINITTTPHAVIREPFDFLRLQFGEDMAANNSLLLEGGTFYYIDTIIVEGGLRLALVVVFPTEDAVGDADRSSLTALILSVVISVCCGIILSLIVALIVRPFNQLAIDMEAVAWMKLDNVGALSYTGHIKEVYIMLQSFKVMHSNLLEYKQYLPQSVLCEKEVESSSTDEMLDEEVTSPMTSDGGSRGSFRETRSNRHRMHSVSSAGSSRVSKKSSRASSGRSVVALTNFSVGLQKRHITVVVVNLVGFHGKLYSFPQQKLISLHASYVEQCNSQVVSKGGIVEGFEGDRVSASFNSVTRAVSHRVKASICAVSIRDELSYERENLAVTIGVGGGEAWCGNMGCLGLKKHCNAGGVSALTPFLERLAKYFDLNIAVDPIVASDTMGPFDLRKVTLIKLPLLRSLKGYSTFMLHELVAMRFTGEDWMYKFTDDTYNNIYHHYNEAVDSLFDGKYQEALEHLGRSNLGLLDDELRQLTQSCHEKGVPPEPFCIDM